MADSSPRARQFIACQALAQASPRGQAMAQLQAIAIRPPAAASRTTAGQELQRFKAAPGTAEHAARQVVPVTLDTVFIDKHVADNEAGAIEKTEKRVESGDPVAMAAGILPNSVAPKQTWLDAMNASPVILPPAEDWGGDYGYEDTNVYEKELASLKVQGWEARGQKGQVRAESKAIAKSVGGRWTVAGSTWGDDDDQNPNPGDTKVTVEIDHCGE